MPTGRFAPSPTGALHYGNLRTALLAWLLARSTGSRFLLRIEDLDEERSSPEHEAGQIEDLRALGLDWDGPVVRQSERRDLYRTALGKLEAAGLVYPCWCSRSEIRAAVGAPNGALEGAPPGAYPGICRSLTREQRAERERRAGRPPSLRIDAGAVTMTARDRLHGEISGVVDDFVVRRWDGAYAYNLAVVVDDAAQGVAEVVRGDDIVETTPRQALLHELLGLDVPVYAHVPLVLGPDGQRLAKRHGAVTLEDLAGQGRAPREVLAELAAGLGLAEPGETVSPTALLERFRLESIEPEPLVLPAEAVA